MIEKRRASLRSHSSGDGAFFTVSTRLQLTVLGSGCSRLQRFLPIFHMKDVLSITLLNTTARRSTAITQEVEAKDLCGAKKKESHSVSSSQSAFPHSHPTYFSRRWHQPRSLSSIELNLSALRVMLRSSHQVPGQAIA